MFARILTNSLLIARCFVKRNIAKSCECDVYRFYGRTKTPFLPFDCEWERLPIHKRHETPGFSFTMRLRCICEITFHFDIVIKK